MIFPGMNPYLENPLIWPGVHNSLIVYFRDQLQPILAPRYVAAVEERVFVESSNRQVIPDVSIKKTPPSAREPDVEKESNVAVVVAADVKVVDEPLVVQVPNLEIHESTIEILDLQEGRRVVTVIELVSPTNKSSGPGRYSYRSKQAEVLSSASHLVEIDLLRTGQHVLAVPEWAVRDKLTYDYDYLVCVNRADRSRDRYLLYPCGLRDRLPRIAIPLADNDPDVPLDIQSGIDRVHETGGYQRLIDYSTPCEPALGENDQTWATEQLAKSTASTPKE